ncbi:MAG: hypothetical protein Q7K55_05450 [Candidatus Levybacteria bacterium]|nr:hypothetical protein [Candidatus Levybacteria bacterium]
MKKIILGLFILITLTFVVPVSPVEAVYVNGYYRSSGTYVEPYYRSRANAYTYDNYSYTSPSYSNGYGYNNSYYSGNSYSSDWYTPSYSDYDYDYGYNYYQSGY